MICDLAETYHVLDYKSLPADTVATLVVGLPDTSRLKLHYGRSRLNMDRILLAAILDGIHTLAWMQSKDGAKGRHRPESVLKSLLGGDHKKEEIMTFNSSKDFLAEREKILRRVKRGD